jgi:hypothetical protein
LYTRLGLTPRIKNALRMYENGVLRIFGPIRQDWRKMGSSAS